MAKRLPLVTEKVLSQVRAGREEINEPFEDLALSSGVSCKKGCSHCCYHPVAASILEGALLYQELKRLGKWTGALRKEIDRVARLTVGLPPEMWMVAHIACPLLQDGLCLGYHSRPFQCLTTWSKGDPDLCHPHRFTRTTPIVPRMAETVEFQALERKLLQQLGLTYRTVPLALAVQVGERIANGTLELNASDAEVLKEFLQAWA